LELPAELGGELTVELIVEISDDELYQRLLLKSGGVEAVEPIEEELVDGADGSRTSVER
jgi:hypothetical protein